jgi:hypothetical protein
VINAPFPEISHLLLLASFQTKTSGGRTGPAVRQFLVGWRAGRVHLGQIESDVLLEQIDPRAWRFGLAADGGRHRDPMAFLLAEIFDRCRNLAVFLGQVVDDIVDRFEIFGVAGGTPGRKGENIMPAVRLRFGSDRQQVLVAL